MKKTLSTCMKVACITSFLALAVCGIFFITHFVVSGNLHKQAESWFYTFSGAFWLTMIAVHLISHQTLNKERMSLLSRS